jgi:dolichol-phosphate mannosyltransferase
MSGSFCREFEQVMRAYVGTDDISQVVELIFVNDGSPNESLAQLRKTSDRFSFVRVIGLSRNFGQHIALSAGYQHARGQFVGSLNVDMQDPPNQIPLLLDRIERGDVDIVIGLRRDRKDSLSTRLTSHVFHYVLGKLTGYPIPLNMATIRIMNRRFVNAYNSLREKSRFLPGLEGWLGFERGYVEIEHEERTVGSSTYNFRKRFLMALDSIISFSDLPLRIVVLAGSAIAVLGLGLGALLVVQKLFFVNLQPGYTSTVSIVVFFGGMQILVVGLASLYIGRILKEVQNRPLYVVQEFIGFDGGLDTVSQVSCDGIPGADKTVASKRGGVE